MEKLSVVSLKKESFMKKIVAINASPRGNMNTATLVKEAAKGAEKAGASVQFFDLYRLDKYNGCASCFACKRAPNEGKCIFKDGLAPVLEAIREADGLIVGSPNYLGDITAALKALFERLSFQSLTYQMNPVRYEHKRIPVLFIMTSNAPLAFYDRAGYTDMIKRYTRSLEDCAGKAKVLIADNTVQVKDYSRYNWDMFDPKMKIKYNETAFEQRKEESLNLGNEMVVSSWEI